MSTDAAAMVASHQLLRVVAVVPESDLVTSYWLAPADRASLAAPVAGQFLPIAVDVPGHGVLRRNYTISGWEANRYRLSIKRERLAGLPPGRVSNHIHDHWTVGYRFSAGTPQGGFVLDSVSMRPIVMLAGGIGVTPLLAMLRALAVCEPGRQVVLIIAARHNREHPFRMEVAGLARRMPNLSVHVRYSEPSGQAPGGQAPDSFGFVDEALLRDLMPASDPDVYLCGPAPFMDAMVRALTALGVPEARIRSETFGPASIERRRQRVSPPDSGTEPIVSFAGSQVEAPFGRQAFNLLEFAEDLGLSPAFACRSGSCGSCAARVLSGAVRYVEEPTAVVAEDEVLLCCALPAGPLSLDL
jgi:ferredoxin-NADP reductase